MLPEPVDRWRSRQQTETLPGGRRHSALTDVVHTVHTAFLSLGEPLSADLLLLICSIDLLLSLPTQRTFYRLRARNK